MRGGDDDNVTHQSLTKAWKSPEKPMAGGSRGGSSCSTFVSTSKSVLQFWYGNCPVASSTCGDSRGQRCHWGGTSGDTMGGKEGQQGTVVSRGGGQVGTLWGEVGRDMEGTRWHQERGQWGHWGWGGHGGTTVRTAGAQQGCGGTCGDRRDVGGGQQGRGGGTAGMW